MLLLHIFLSDAIGCLELAAFGARFFRGEEGGGGGGGVGSLFSGNKNHETKLALVLISEMQNCMIRTALKQEKE